MAVTPIIENRGGYNITKYQIDVSEDMRNRALAFATRIKFSDNQYHRLIPQRLQNSIREHMRQNDIPGVLCDTTEILKIETQRTYIGKLGELVFLELLSNSNINYPTDAMFEIYDGQENVDEFDFRTVQGNTVDIKTGFRSNHTRLLINRDQFENSPKDYYVGIKLNATDTPNNDYLVEWDSIHTAFVEGYADREFLSSHVEYQNFGEGPAKSRAYNRLLAINRLLTQFQHNQ